MRPNSPQYIVAATTAGLVALFSFGCADPTIDEEDAQQYADEWASNLEELLTEHAVADAAGEALEQQLREAAEDEEQQIRSDEAPYAVLVEEVYQDREFEPGLIDHDEMTAAGEAVLDELRHVEDHNLDAEFYQLDAIEQAVDAWGEQGDSVEQFDGLEPTDEDRNDAIAWLVEQPVEEFDLSDDNLAVLTEALIEDDELGGRLNQVVEDYQQKQGAIIETGAQVETLLAVGLARYAGEQRGHIKELWVHPRHWDFYNEPDMEDTGPRPDPDKGAFRGGQVWREAANIAKDMTEENRYDILDERVQKIVKEVLDSDDPEQRVAEIPPQHPQYEGLVEEYRRYRAIVEDGGWEEVPRNDHLTPGATSETVGKLKQRLQIEGYYPEDADIDDTFDQKLTDAIREYQQTHQMEVSGRPNHVFWYSLNIPAERRLDQIGLNMDRWRESNIDHSKPTYLFVNIPDFTIELWHEQKREMRFATIVGDNDKDINPLTDEEEHANRTPTPMAKYTDRVIFNPYWNVTERIRAHRILPDVKESIEAKYAMKFDHYLERAKAGEDDVGSEEVTLASVTGAIGLPGEDRDDDIGSELPESDGDEFEQIAGEVDPDDLDEERLEEQLEEHADDEDDGDEDQDDTPAIDELSEEERQELKAEVIAEKTQETLNSWTEMRQVRNEEADRMENERFFRTARLQQLESEVFGGDAEAFEEFQQRFPYVDFETGEVDVESTDPDHIPSWYAANGYEVVHPGHDTWEYVRMLPGEKNALGFVKIIFPNYDNIYLHDTPEKSLFSRPVRGFSHGCIRLEEPMSLSDRLLELGSDDDHNIDQILASEEYLPIFLDRHIPVYLEYYTVRIDEEGRANFLADIYDYDDEELGESS